jgi:hypothetical protein
MNAVVSIQQAQQDQITPKDHALVVAQAQQPVNDLVASLLKPSRTYSRFNDAETELLGIAEEWIAPKTVPAEAVPALQQQLSLLDEALAPAQRPAVLARVLALLSHYRQDPLPEAVEAAIAEDWADDLGEYPFWVLEDAARQWRRDPKKYRFKPLPGDIRRICEEIVAKPETMRKRVRTLLTKAGAAVTALPGSEAAIHPMLAARLQDRIAQIALTKRIA